jgi:hypothetical protein
MGRVRFIYSTVKLELVVVGESDETCTGYMTRIHIRLVEDIVMKHMQL